MQRAHRRIARGLAWALLVISLVPVATAFGQDARSADAQPGSKKLKPQRGNVEKKGGVKPGISVRPAPVTHFRPTCNLDSGSVGAYFFPPNLGAKWTTRTITQVMDNSNNLLRCDTMFHFERVVSDSDRTLQGLPVLRCESSIGFRFGHEADAKTSPVEYYLDDSVILAVFNHSVTNSLNHVMLVNPLAVGKSWRDNTDDSIHTIVVATDEPVSTPIGDFARSLVVESHIGFGVLAKFFVPHVGIVRTVFRGTSPARDGTYVSTTELVKLDVGDTTRSIAKRFAPEPAPPQPVDLTPAGATPKKTKKVTAPRSAH